MPGSAFHVSFLEFKGIDTQPLPEGHSRQQDPGSPVLRLRVRDVDSIIKALDAVGVPVALKPTATGFNKLIEPCEYSNAVPR